MRVWFDILTPKQFWFFTSIEKSLKELGVDVILTSRRYDQLTPIIEDVGRSDIPLIGEYGGGTLIGKLRASVRRAIDLLEYIDGKYPDLCISSGSFEAVRISYGLRIKHILLSDTPESPVNRFCVPLSDYVVTPWIIPKKVWANYGIKNSRILRYRALDPYAWLSDFKPSNRILSKYSLEPFSYILVRMPETEASYLMNADSGWIAKFIELLVKRVKDKKIVVMIRYESHLRMLEHLRNDVTIIDRPVADHSLLYYSSLFIGGGGTMTQESVLMGIPTISIFPGKLTAIHKYLIKIGSIKHFKNPKLALEWILRNMSKLDDIKRKQQMLSEKLKKKMVNPAKYIANLLVSLNS